MRSFCCLDPNDEYRRSDIVIANILFSIIRWIEFASLNQNLSKGSYYLANR